MMRLRYLGVATVLAVVGGMTAFAADLENADPAVQYRVNVMRGISANASAIGLTLRNNLPQTQNLGLHAEAIALGARTAVSAFQPNVPDGVAKPEVWEDQADFQGRLLKLAAAADDVAHAAREQGINAAKPKLDVMFPMCKSCHDVYRKK